MPASGRQHDAITAPLGPVLVLAGPGAGKTYCLIGRVAHLIERCHVPPERVCAVTFTNRAAEEVAGRLRARLGSTASDITRGTLHGLCVEILREHGAAIGLRRGFGIADEPYQSAVLGRLGVWPARRRPAILQLFGRRRLAQYQLTSGDERLFERYVAYLRERNLLDFDDLIAHTADLFQRHADIAALVAARWDQVLVDEFQDLDGAQYQIVHALARHHRNVFAVGDDEQSIFSWRGADARVLRRFVEDFGISQPIVLDENRRCSRQIFEVARRLIGENEPLFVKDLRATRESEHDVRALAFEDEVAEAQWIAQDILADRAAGNRPWGEYAVLYRLHQLGGVIERQLIRSGIPCRLAPRRALLDDQVVKSVVASLRVMRSPDDPAALDALAEAVLSETALDPIRSEAKRENLDLLAAARAFARRRGRGDPDAKKAWRFTVHVENLRALARAQGTLREVVQALLQQRPGRYRNVLEEVSADLTDPATQPAAVALADRLRGAALADGRVWLAPADGVEVALRGMLMAVGWTGVDYLKPGAEPELGDLVVGPDDAGPGGLVLTTFKALQLRHAGSPQPTFRQYVAFDLETTDKDPLHCDIVEIGAVRVRDGMPMEEFRSLVRPAGAVAATARDVHGYDDTELAGAPPFGEVWPKFLQFVGGDVLVAHNAHRFDIPVLRRAARDLAGFDQLAFYDTYRLAKALTDGAAALAALAERFGIAPGRAHHALDDARALVAVFGELERLRAARARTASLTNLLDWVGVGLALERDNHGDEARLLREIGGAYALGRYSDVLEEYERERARLGNEALPSPDELIERLGGRARMERLRAVPDPAARFPQTVARLEALIESAEGATLDVSIGRFLERVALSTSDGVDAAPDRVNLLTLHATKGLEFSRVYVVGVEDDQLLPRHGQEYHRAELEEARRLLYVGMTRAEDRLILTRAARRGGVATGGSRFLDEMGIVPSSGH